MLKQITQKLQQYRNRMILGFLAVGLLVGLILGKKVIFAIFWPPSKPVEGFNVAPPASGLSEIPTGEVKLPVTLKTHDKKKAARKIDLPQAVVDNPDQVLVSTATVEPSEGGSTIATVIDTTTGVASTIEKKEPRPFIGWGGSGGVGVRGGIGTSGITAAVYARQKLIRLGYVQVQAYSEITANESGRAEAKALLDVELFRWE